MKKVLATVRFDGWTWLLLLCLNAFTASLVGAEKIDARFDIVAVLTHDSQKDQLTHMKSAFKTLPTPFELGLSKVRLAVVSGALTTKDAPTKFEPDATVIMNLNTNLALYEAIVDNFRSELANEKYSTHWGRTFDVIRTQLFTNARRYGDRGYAVVLIMSNLGANVQEGISKAKELRDAGAWLHIVTKDKPDMAKIANEMAGSSFRRGRTETVVLISEAEFDTGLVSAMESVKKAIYNHTCHWDIFCFFKDHERKNCVNQSSQQFMNRWHSACEPAFKPHIICETEKTCMEWCKWRWPWEQEPCKDKCGGTDGKRRGTAPPKMENCPQQVPCPTCAITSRATAASTPTASVSTASASTASTSTASTSTVNISTTNTSTTNISTTSTSMVNISTTNTSTVNISTTSTSTALGRTSTSTATTRSTAKPTSTVTKTPATQLATTTADSGATSHSALAEEKSTQKTGSSSMVVIIAAVVPIIVLAIVIAVIAFFVTKRAREKKRQSAAKAGAMKVAVPKVAAPSPVKEGPTGKEVAVGTVGTATRGKAETAVAADLADLSAFHSKR